jgi:hypothetical protein
VERDTDLAFGDTTMASFGGGDDDGGGFEAAAGVGDNFMDDDHFNVELEGIRKVEKIEVGYARTSTKVSEASAKKN